MAGRSRSQAVRVDPASVEFVDLLDGPIEPSMHASVAGLELVEAVEVALDDDLDARIEVVRDRAGSAARLRLPAVAQCLLECEVVVVFGHLFGELMAVATRPALAALVAGLVLRDLDHPIALVDPVFLEVDEFANAEAEAAADEQDQPRFEAEVVIVKPMGSLEQQLELSVFEGVVGRVSDALCLSCFTSAVLGTFLSRSIERGHASVTSPERGVRRSTAGPSVMW